MTLIVRRIRAALSVGLTWAVAGGVIGAVFNALPGMDTDLPMPLLFGALGLIAGITFSSILVVIGRRGIARLSLPRFAGWGALGGLAIAGVITAGAAYRGENVMNEFLLFGPALIIASAGCAAGSLALARRADARQLRAPLEVSGESRLPEV